jgi:farnesyl-diphosphate farnesyltransferase
MSLSRRHDDVRDDLAFCMAALPEVSRTFAVSIEALPDSLREAVRTAYLLCRIVDTVEDDPGLQRADRRLLFGRFDALLADDEADPLFFEEACAELLTGAGGSEAEHELCLNAGAVFRRFRALSPAQRAAIRPHIAEMSRGMREYALRAAGDLGLASMTDLERYCYFVAGTVGELLTSLFLQIVPVDEATRAELDARAVSFGLGLQLVNIVKDAAADFSRGVCYLPRGLAERLGLPLGALLDPPRRELALALVRAVCQRARHHLDRAREYTELWPVPAGLPIRLFCAVPLALALETLDEVEHGPDTLQPGRCPKVTRESFSRIQRDAASAVLTNQSLEELFSLGGPCCGDIAPGPRAESSAGSSRS